MKTRVWAAFLAVLAWGGVPATGAERGELRVEIRTPAPDLQISGEERWVEVEGGASTIGGVRQLDMFLLLDTSSSLKRTDPEDYRAAGARGLVESIPAKSDTQIGVIAFDKRSEVISPLTSDRDAVLAALRDLDRSGSTDLAAGMRRALAGFDEGARVGSSRAMLIFTDGKAKDRSAREAIRRAMRRAHSQGVAVHSLLLGSDAKGRATLREIADETGGSFLQVTDPARLPEAFLNLRTAGVDTVALRVNGGETISARLTGSMFSARVALEEGENRIVATATSLRGETKTDAVRVVLRDTGCAELSVEATSDGKPALSISDRAVEIVFDASRSMWGRMEGRPKMAVAKDILNDSLDWMSPDLNLSLRAYGHRHASELRNCSDSELLVPAASGNRDRIREAIAGLRPNGQTPIGYALGQIAADLGDFRGERAVVLVTDGIESCGQDPVAAARALQADGPIPIHVIGFGLGNEVDEDLASLRGIADASGGKFLTAHSADELRLAFEKLVGTSFDVWREGTQVAAGTLGSDEVVRLPAGSYSVRLDSVPPQELPVELVGEELLTVVFERDADSVSHTELRDETAYASCEPLDPGHARLASRPEGRVPRARRARSLAIPDGSVEIWQNLRRNRSDEWGVVVRHPDKPGGSEVIWRGNDLVLAEDAARRAQHELRGASLPASPAR